MNNVCLCIGNYAENPFYLKFSDVYIYSIEELCYYFMDKVHILDDSMVTMELVVWIKEECGLEELAQELEIYVRKHVSIAVFVSTILERTQMYDEETIRKIDRILKEQANLSMPERYRKRAEYLYRSGRFRQALTLYFELLDFTSSKNTQTRAEMYYNIASIYAIDFAYEQAADYYMKSYKLKPDKKTRVAYILAKRKCMSDYAYGSFIRENSEWAEEFEKVEQLLIQVDNKWQTSKERRLLEDLSYLKQSGKIEKYHIKTGELIKNLKQDYRRQTL